MESEKKSGKKHDNCCGSCDDNGLSSADTGRKKTKKRINGILGWVLAVLLFGNLLVMGIYSVVVGKKLNEAISQTAPQTGDLVLIKPAGCSDCGELSGIKSLVAGQNVDLLQDRIVLSDTEDARQLIERYSIKKLPAMIFESKEPIKTAFKSAVEKDSRLDGDSVLIWEPSQPPYFDLSNDKPVGLVSIVYLTDKTCDQCYDVVRVQQPVLTNFGLALTSSKRFDISDEKGQDIIKKYSITKVPTIVLSSEAGDYQAFAAIWKDVGTFEEDGSLVFRNMDVLGATYKDLQSNKIVTAPIK